jgi:hypothetical protein
MADCLSCAAELLSNNYFRISLIKQKKPAIFKLSRKRIRSMKIGLGKSFQPHSERCIRKIKESGSESKNHDSNLGKKRKKRVLAK